MVYLCSLQHPLIWPAGAEASSSKITCSCNKPGDPGLHLGPSFRLCVPVNVGHSKRLLEPPPSMAARF